MPNIQVDYAKLSDAAFEIQSSTNAYRNHKKMMVQGQMVSDIASWRGSDKDQFEEKWY